MAILGKPKLPKETPGNSILDVTANMQGSLVFQEPVVLRISGGFEGTLETKGDLTIGERATVAADITGEVITVAGKVNGRILAKRSLRIIPPAVVRGEIVTPSLEIQPGAWIEATIRMTKEETSWVSLQEVAEYLEVESRIVEQWAREKKIPALLEGSQWRFDKTKIDEWVAAQKSS